MTEKAVETHTSRGGDDLKLAGAESLRRLRRATGLTIKQVAQQVGVSEKTAWRWENEQGVPDVVQSRALAGLFGITLEDVYRLFTDAPVV